MTTLSTRLSCLTRLFQQKLLAIMTTHSNIHPHPHLTSTMSIPHDLIPRVAAYVKQHMDQNDGSHDYNHIKRVLALPRHIAAQLAPPRTPPHTPPPRHSSTPPSSPSARSCMTSATGSTCAKANPATPRCTTCS